VVLWHDAKGCRINEWFDSTRIGEIHASSFDASSHLYFVSFKPSEEAQVIARPFAHFPLRGLAAVLQGAVFTILMALPAFGQKNPDRNAYFGELHIHSSWSVDAYVFGTRIGPEDATKYAMGQPVIHPGGFRVQLKQPLDFTVVMDHSEYTGALAMADDPTRR
jgi:Protein of unknown function (DUF3604)